MNVLGLFLWILVLVSMPNTIWGSQFATDIERLESGLGPDFEKTMVIIYPLIDQRPLFQEEPLTARQDDPGRQAWSEFLTTLRAYPNLEVKLPHQTVADIKGRQRYQDALALSLNTIRLGNEAYGEVRLHRAVENLTAGAKTLKDIEHHIVAPRAVAKTMLTRGLALLEQGEALRAQLALQDALLMDPSLRLKPGFDHPKALRALAQARSALVAEGPIAPPEFRLRETKRVRSAKTHVIRARLLPGALEVVIISAGSVRLRSQTLADGLYDPGSRLASAVQNCLPFGKTRRPRHRPYLLMDMGFSHFIFARSPVGTFGHIGVSLHGSWRFSRHLSLETEATVSNSNRDSQEHLREDISSLRLRASPGANWRLGPLNLSAHLGLEAAVLSDIVITTNPACKFFGAQANVPRDVCDFGSDVNRIPPAAAVGPGLELAARIRLVDQLYLSARMGVTTFVFKTQELDFDWPLGAAINLGYRIY